MRQPSPIRPLRSDCGTYGLIPSRTDEQRRTDLEADVARDLRHALQLDQNVVFHFAGGPSPQRVADFLRESGNRVADDVFAALVARAARPTETEAVLASLVRRWLTTSETLAVQILVAAMDEGQRVTFEARQ